jgi:hypothetical protein
VTLLLETKEERARELILRILFCCKSQALVAIAIAVAAVGADRPPAALTEVEVARDVESRRCHIEEVRIVVVMGNILN